jgi:hypothetical protein
VNDTGHRSLQALSGVAIWEIIIIWALGASVAATFAILVVLAVIFWISRKLD